MKEGGGAPEYWRPKVNPVPAPEVSKPACANATPAAVFLSTIVVCVTAIIIAVIVSR